LVLSAIHPGSVILGIADIIPLPASAFLRVFVAPNDYHLKLNIRALSKWKNQNGSADRNSWSD
jgi:hypothetical protein